MSAADAEAERVLASLLGDPAARRSPYPWYARLREIAPVHRSELAGCVVVSTMAHCRALLLDDSLGKGEVRPDDAVGRAGVVQNVPLAMRSASLVYANPPQHTRLRAMVSDAFGASRIAGLRPRIEAVAAAAVDDLAARAAGGQPIDFLDHLAFPVPVQVIGGMLGFDAEDLAQFRPWVRAQAAALEPGADRDAIAEAARAANQMTVAFNALVRARRRSPRDDVVTALLAARDEGGQPMTKAEVVATAGLLLGAGFETTMNLLASAVATVAPMSDVWDDMAGSDDLVGSVVEEVLRFEAPLQIDARVALRATKVGDQPVAPGEWVVAVLAAANRDPAAYEDPDQFRPERFGRGRSACPPSLSFSAGIHHCLGASLARLEARVVLSTLARRFRAPELVETPPAWRPTLVSRGLTRLPLRLLPR